MANLTTSHGDVAIAPTGRRDGEHAVFVHGRVRFCGPFEAAYTIYQQLLLQRRLPVQKTGDRAIADRALRRAVGVPA